MLLIWTILLNVEAWKGVHKTTMIICSSVLPGIWYSGTSKHPIVSLSSRLVAVENDSEFPTRINFEHACHGSARCYGNRRVTISGRITRMSRQTEFFFISLFPFFLLQHHLEAQCLLFLPCYGLVELSWCAFDAVLPVLPCHLCLSCLESGSSSS